MLKIATKFAPDLPAFEMACAAGFRYAEFWLNAERLQEVEQIIERALQYPLEYVPHLPNKKVTAATVSQSVRLYQQLNCQALVLHQPMMNEWGKELLAQCPDMRLAVENHVLSEKEFWRWAEENPGLNLDIEHLWMFTLKQEKLSQVEKVLIRFLEKYRPKLNHIHLPGYWPGLEEHRPMYCSRELMFMVWPLLAAFDYTGFVVSEVDNAYQTPQDLRMDLLLYERWQEIRKSTSVDK